MNEPDDDDNIDLAAINPLHQATGEAIEAYAMVESNLASLLQAILKVDMFQAHAIFFEIQNSRAKNELFQQLLEKRFKGGVKKYWASCSEFLLKLAQFRNALAHWHPFIAIYVSKDETKTKTKNALGHPVIGSPFKSIEIEDFPPFLKDCLHIRQELSALIALMKEPLEPLPEKFQRPIAHRNLAVLQSRRKPKAQQPRRPPSVPKLSVAQKRAKALKDARTKKP